MEKNVLEFLENSQRMYGEKTACADMNNELTYTQLMNQAKFIGSCLSLKIKPTQGVPVYMDKTCNTLYLSLRKIKYEGLRGCFSAITFHNPSCRLVHRAPFLQIVISITSLYLGDCYIDIVCPISYPLSHHR